MKKQPQKCRYVKNIVTSNFIKMNLVFFALMTHQWYHKCKHVCIQWAVLVCKVSVLNDTNTIDRIHDRMNWDYRRKINNEREISVAWKKVEKMKEREREKNKSIFTLVFNFIFKYKFWVKTDCPHLFRE